MIGHTFAIEVGDNVTPVTQAVTFSLVAGIFALATVYLNNRSKKHSEELMARQHERDQAAIEAAKVAEDERQTAKEARDYARLDEVARRAEASSLATMRKLTHVEETTTLTHAMVNSDKTAGLADRLDDKIAQLALMHEIVALKTAAGREPTVETMNAIDTLEHSIVTLRAHIADRLKQQTAAEEQNRMEATGSAPTTFGPDGNPLGVVEALQKRVDTLETPAEQG